MSLKNPEILWLWLAVLVAAGLAVRAYRHRSASGIPLAHLERLRTLPRYRTLVRRQRAFTALSAVLLLVAVVASIVLTARPQATASVQPPHKSRDVMLCLDVSGSMTEVDSRILSQFEQIASRLDGDRVGLTIFNTQAVSVVPLTDDYDFLRRELRRGARALREYDYGFTSGTMGRDGRSSLTPDGLASCIDRFDRLDEERPRSIVLASDNDLNGAPIFTLDEATAMATRRGIRVYAIDPSLTPTPDFRPLVERTGGLYTQVDDAGLVDAFVSRISAEEARRTREAPRREQRDNPLPASLLLAPTVLLALAALRGVRR